MSPSLTPAVANPAAPLDVEGAYRAHAGYVWRTLHRLGVRTDDAPDLLQEVFAVVHRRRADWDGRPLEPWLYGIALGLVRNARRRYARPAIPLTPSPVAGPEEALEASERRARAERVLGALDPEKRAVFVMFEVEGLSGKAIAERLGVPLGTVHSRIHAARRELSAALAATEAV